MIADIETPFHAGPFLLIPICRRNLGAPEAPSVISLESLGMSSSASPWNFLTNEHLGISIT